MEEWKTYKLSELSSFRTGKLDSNASCKNGKYPFFTCSPETLTIDEYAFDQKAILLAGNNAEGNFSVKYYEGKFNAYQRTYVFTVNEELVNPFFFYYALKLCLADFKQVSQGTSTKFLTAKILNSFTIRLPELKTQNLVAGILNSLDEKIAINYRINHILEEQASCHFMEWCRGCNEDKAIADLAFNILDYSPNQQKKVILLNSSDVTEGRFESLPFVDNKDLKGQFKKRFRRGDILYSEIRPRNHHYAICYFDPKDYIASTRLMVIRRRPELLASDALLYQYLLMPKVEEEFTAKTESRSGTFPQGNYEDLSSSIVPYCKENQDISNMLDALYSIIWHNMEENKRLALLRDTLLPKLMSGEIAV
jgi:type I restriction enzyme S subunit